MEQKSNILWVVLGIVIALVVAGSVIFVYYFYFFKTESTETSPSPTPTASTSASPSPSSSSNLTTYQSDCCGFSFDYPNDWEIEDYYFYETAGGEKAKIPTIVLKRKSDPKGPQHNKIWFNMRQADCDAPGTTKSTESAGSIPVNIYTPSGGGEICIQATVTGQMTDGRKTDYNVLSYYSDPEVKSAFKTIVSTFKVAPL